MEELWLKVTSFIRTIGISDVIDVILVAYLVYQLIKLVRDTRAIQLVKGIVALLILYFFVVQFEFKTMSFILRALLSTGLLALIIIFQPELRRMLEHMAQSKLGSFNLFSAAQSNETAPEVAATNNAIDAVTQAAESLSRLKIGALIVFERKTMLGEIVHTGTVIDSAPSEELIGNIFFPNSPLHDGAMVIRNGRLLAAGCFLPLSENYRISREMGTRHRAALGMSENSDAIIVVVSEETGTISLAENGKIERHFTPEQLAQRLRRELIPEPEKKEETNNVIRSALRKVKK